MRTLFLAWQAPNRTWFPIGRLDADIDHSLFVFHYTNGALRAQSEAGLKPMPAFPKFKERYQSSELFPLFKNRVLGPQRKDFQEYVRSLGLTTVVDPIEILGVTGGERQTDSFEVFPRLEKNRNNEFECRFFLHGWRHMSRDAHHRVSTLKPDDALFVSIELTNPTGQLAVQLTTTDYQFVGWSPRYLVNDLVAAAVEFPHIKAKVVRTNSEETPVNRRILVQMTGQLPTEYEPMSSADFQVLQ